MIDLRLSRGIPSRDVLRSVFALSLQLLDDAQHRGNLRCTPARTAQHSEIEVILGLEVYFQT
jgi:hypothetical protein